MTAALARGGALHVLRAAAEGGLVLPAPGPHLGPDTPWPDAPIAVRVAAHEAGHAVLCRLVGWPMGACMCGKRS